MSAPEMPCCPFPFQLSYVSYNLLKKKFYRKKSSTMIRTGLLILVELIDLVNFVITFLSQMTLLRWLTFLLGSQTVIL